MGFDNECILNIQSLAGEYFCPVCRTLVYPNEALQSQCTHLYCKPCLTYVVSTTSACPYDGYLVTEADAKPLIESNKALAETIGKILVHCLYHRSGCTWQGALSECTSHCSGCAFGNSPVVCNRCGIQIVHRQVQEHAQNCPGVNTQAQQPTDDARDPAASGTTTTVAQSQTVPQSAAPTSQSQISQTATAPVTGQEQNQQANANPQAQVAVSVLPTPDQWYQQQYQQYYQQYPGYETYQQNYQHYYPYPQQAIQQYQQPSVQAPQQSQVYSQPHSQPQLQPQARPQSLSQPRPQAPIQSQTLPPNPPHLQPQQPQPSQASVGSQPQNQGQINPQQQLHPAGQHNASQIRPLPHSHMPPQPLAPPPQPHLMQPTSHQHMQLPQQSHSHIHFPQPHSQVPGPLHPQPLSQVQAQPQPYHQPQPLPQTHAQLQLHNHPSAHPQVHSAHSNQTPSSNAPPQAQPQSQHPPPLHAVTGHHSYPQLQVHQQMQGGTQQHAMYVQPPGGPLSYPQVNSQLPQVPQMRPLHTHVQFSNQQQPGVQQQQMHPQGQQPGQLVPLRPGMQTIQQALPQQYAQQHQPFPAQAPAAVQTQLHGSYAQQQSVQPLAQSHLIPQSQHFAGVHSMLPPQSQNYSGRPMINSSQTLLPTSGTFVVATHVRPMQLGSNQPSGYQTQENRTNNQLPSTTLQATITEQRDHVSHNNVVDREDGSPSQKKAEIGVDSVDAKAVKSQSDLNAEHKHEGEGVDDSSKGKTLSKENLGEPVVKNTVKEEASEGSLVASPGGNSVEIASLEKDATKVVPEGGSAIGKEGSINGEPEKLPKDAVDVNLQTSAGVGHSAAAVPRFTSLPDQSRHQLPPMQHGLSTHQQRPSATPSALHSVPSQGAPLHAQVPGHPPSVVRPQVPGLLPQPGQVSNPPEHFQSFMGGVPDRGSTTSFERGPGQLDLPAPQGHYRHGLAPPPQAGFPSGVDPQSVIVERAPPPGSDGPYGLHRPINPLESEMFLKQRAQPFDGQLDAYAPRLLERGPFGQPSGSELSTMKINGSSGTESSSKVGLQDERFRDHPSEHLNPFLVEPSRRVAKGEFEEDLRRFSRPLHLDNDPGSYFNSARPFDSGSHGFGMGAAPRPLDTAQQAGLRLHSPVSGAPARFFPHPNAAAERTVPVGPLDDNRWRPDPSRLNPEFIGPGFGRHYMDNTVSRSPGREYLRGLGGPSGAPHSYDDINIRKRHPFGEGSRSYNLSDPVGNSFHEGRFPVIPVQSRRGELDHNHRMGDLIGQDTLPGPLRRGELLGPRNLPNHLRLGEPNNYGPFPGHARIGELTGTGNFPHHLPRGDSFGSNKPSNPRLGEPGFRSSYSLQGFASEGGYFSGDMDPFSKSRKRKAASMGWCRICKVDCETVEGLDLHSQTREHQKMAMDMVMSIKKQNAKKQKVLNDRSTTEVGSKPKNASMEGHSSKP